MPCNNPEIRNDSTDIAGIALSIEGDISGLMQMISGLNTGYFLQNTKSPDRSREENVPILTSMAQEPSISMSTSYGSSRQYHTCCPAFQA